MHIFQLFECHVCQKKAGKNELRKHYKRKHRNVQFQADLVNFIAAIEERFECNICNTKVDEVSRTQHRKKFHANFKNFNNLYTETTFKEDKINKELSERKGQSDLQFVIDLKKPINLTEVELIEIKWLERDKKKPKKRPGRCAICKRQMDPSIFVQHFVRLHSNQLNKMRNNRSLKPDLKSAEIIKNEVELDKMDLKHSLQSDFKPPEMIKNEEEPDFEPPKMMKKEVVEDDDSMQFKHSMDPDFKPPEIIKNEVVDGK